MFQNGSFLRRAKRFKLQRRSHHNHQIEASVPYGAGYGNPYAYYSAAAAAAGYKTSSYPSLPASAYALPPPAFGQAVAAQQYAYSANQAAMATPTAVKDWPTTAGSTAYNTPYAAAYSTTASTTLSSPLPPPTSTQLNSYLSQNATPNLSSYHAAFQQTAGSHYPPLQRLQTA